MFNVALVTLLLVSIPYQVIFMVASHFNYAGGEAMLQFHRKILPQYLAKRYGPRYSKSLTQGQSSRPVISLYYDIEAAMSGATLFSQKHSYDDGYFDDDDDQGVGGVGVGLGEGGIIHATTISPVNLYRGQRYDLIYSKNESLDPSRMNDDDPNAIALLLNHTFIITAHPLTDNTKKVWLTIYGFSSYQVSAPSKELQLSYARFLVSPSLTDLVRSHMQLFFQCLYNQCSKNLAGTRAGPWNVLECALVHGGCFGGFRLALVPKLYILGPSDAAIGVSEDVAGTGGSKTMSDQ